MKTWRFSDAQKAFILKQGADGIPVAEICRRTGIWSLEFPGFDGHNPGAVQIDTADPRLPERLVAQRFRRDELSKEIGDLQRRLSSAEPAITPEKVNRLGVLLLE